MRCDTARRALSDRIDLPLDAHADDVLDAHLAGCEACRSFTAHLDGVRRHLHVAPVEAPPDVAPRVRARLEAGEQRRRVPAPLGRAPALASVAAVFLAAAVLGASIVGLPPGPREAQATDVSSLVLAGQRNLTSLVATVEVVEYGWHPEVPVREYLGRLTYVAPEALALELGDVTTYPDGPWQPNDATVVVDETRSWQSGPARCPTVGLPDCTPEEPRVAVVEHREPFDPADPVPLDLVLPVASFGVGGDEADLGEAEVAGHAAVGVEVTAAQVTPLLEGIRRAGNWRPVHPTDTARIWLDAELGVPLMVEVVASAGYERDRWAAANGLDEQAGDPVLTWRLSDVEVNHLGSADPRPRLPDPPASVEPVDRGYLDDPTAGLEPAWLPAGMAPHRAGRAGAIEVASFSDGRAWVAVRSTKDWTGTRLFGHGTGVVRRVVLDGAGVGYLAEGGDRVLVHGDGVDLEVVGSLTGDDLVRIAASLGVEGRPVPTGWAEASTASLTEAVAARPSLLVLPEGLDGFDGPAVSMTDRGVVQSFSGGGARAFGLSQVDGTSLGPPLDDVVLAVEVRGWTGRYTPDRGTLEWVEGDAVVTLRSRTLGLPELVTIAELLEGMG